MRTGPRCRARERQTAAWVHHAALPLGESGEKALGWVREGACTRQTPIDPPLFLEGRSASCPWDNERCFVDAREAAGIQNEPCLPGPPLTLLCGDRDVSGRGQRPPVGSPSLSSISRTATVSQHGPPHTADIAALAPFLVRRRGHQTPRPKSRARFRK